MEVESARKILRGADPETAFEALKAVATVLSDLGYALSNDHEATRHSITCCRAVTAFAAYLAPQVDFSEALAALDELEETLRPHFTA